MEKSLKFFHQHPPATQKQVPELRKQLEEKDQILKSYELKYSKLFDDFNYNIEVILERDQEIERLNNKITALVQINKEKDSELSTFRKRISQLESDKIILSNRIEALINTNNIPRPGRKTSGTPTSEKSKTKLNKRGFSLDNYHPPNTPLTKLNFDLETRIKALEVESRVKREESPEKETIIVKEKEIADIIKAISNYRRSPNKLFGTETQNFLSNTKKTKDNGPRAVSQVSYPEDAQKISLKNIYSNDKSK